MQRVPGWTLGLASIAVIGCAEPCLDDGLGQANTQACPQAQSGDGDASGQDDNGDGPTAGDPSAGSGTGGDGGLDGDGGSGSVDPDGSGGQIGAESSSSDDGGSLMDASTGSEQTVICIDSDGDGFGGDTCITIDPEAPVPDGYVPQTVGTDCDDSDGDTYPGAAEAEDNEACMQDADHDGYGDATPTSPAAVPGSDCDDDEETTFPGAAPLDDPTACMADADNDDYGDLTPNGGSVQPGTDCDDAQANTHRCVLLVTQDGTIDHPYDDDLQRELVALGYQVIPIEDTATRLEDATNTNLVVVSETAHSADITNTLRTTPRPLVCLEGLIWDDLGMSQREADTPTSDDVQIVAPGDPLAAGLTGTVTVMEGTGAGTFSVEVPASARIIATTPGSPQATYFAYEAGVAMVGGFVAPARRVGLGYDADQTPQVSTANPTPIGLALFRAAVVFADHLED